MLYFLVTFIGLTTIKQWNPLFGSQAMIHPSDDFCPSAYLHHGYHNTTTCDVYNSFPDLDFNNLTLDNTFMESLWHLCDMAAGRKAHNTGCITHNTGCMTHNTAGHVTQPTFVSSIQCCYGLMPGCMTSISVSMKWHHNVTTSYGMKNKLLSCPCHCIVLPHKHRSHSQSDQKLQKRYKCSALPLVLAISRSIYILSVEWYF